MTPKEETEKRWTYGLDSAGEWEIWQIEGDTMNAIGVAWSEDVARLMTMAPTLLAECRRVHAELGALIVPGAMVTARAILAALAGLQALLAQADGPSSTTEKEAAR